MREEWNRSKRGKRKGGREEVRRIKRREGCSVADQDPNPDPDPPDSHVFGHPGSFCHQAKIVRKTLIPTAL